MSKFKPGERVSLRGTYMGHGLVAFDKGQSNIFTYEQLESARRLVKRKKSNYGIRMEKLAEDFAGGFISPHTKFTHASNADELQRERDELAQAVLVASKILIDIQGCEKENCATCRNHAAAFLEIHTDLLKRIKKK